MDEVTRNKTRVISRSHVPGTYAGIYRKFFKNCAHGTECLVAAAPETLIRPS